MHTPECRRWAGPWPRSRRAPAAAPSRRVPSGASLRALHPFIVHLSSIYRPSIVHLSFIDFSFFYCTFPIRYIAARAPSIYSCGRGVQLFIWERRPFIHTREASVYSHGRGRVPSIYSHLPPHLPVVHHPIFFRLLKSFWQPLFGGGAVKVNQRSENYRFGLDVRVSVGLRPFILAVWRPVHLPSCFAGRSIHYRGNNQADRCIHCRGSDANRPIYFVGTFGERLSTQTCCRPHFDRVCCKGTPILTKLSRIK